MAGLLASLPRWTSRTLKFCLPETPWGDLLYSRIHFLYMNGRLPRFRSPRSFNDHIFRLRVGPEAEDALRRTVCDKLLVKDYIARTVGPDYALETLEVLATEREIDRFAPSRFPCVIKPTHASGRVVILRGAGDALDRELLKSWLRLTYYGVHRERVYRSLEKGIIVEELFSDDGFTPPDDYKVFCFEGRPKFIQVDTDRFTAHRRGLYTLDWRRLPLTYRLPLCGEVARPAALDEMVDLARRLSKPFSFIRVDFLYARERLKVGELTNVPSAANCMIRPLAAERRLGRLFADPTLSVEEALGDLA